MRRDADARRRNALAKHRLVVGKNAVTHELQLFAVSRFEHRGPAMRVAEGVKIEPIAARTRALAHVKAKPGVKLLRHGQIWHGENETVH